VASKHFGHVTFYTADVRKLVQYVNKVGKKFYAKNTTVRTEPALDRVD